ncbi:transcriptional regulator NarL [Candidatus Endoriftia persephone str. Guaymas]|jgi:two-component system nitrate/nitrite response regulator NarL|uniref:Nitrate/nitrite response regulator protein NarL n=3 Tax=Gammaproteobacteria TaxID=1236 RepID=G2FE22_9GAMM|nr:two-component system response regulator NarL [Candidatus Endoriftia persephone]EGV52368.1 nitrate/nitrite response regulator protein narL [endosymbiont of Riftia pachyptila (vent Ph05)]EGW55006.1 nitrate/nitrite response regulator protein NarL [endosymbiont of Tevnia jerichonana (vent Tica)]MBA1332090.1 transcriptional regulator NarL [Candidatus Endoriftia persephone str. Guaymas]USF87841.1 two-component system response regulator NarL [Candidatus Endoriftia persephone]
MSDSTVQRVVMIDDHPLLRKGLQQLADLTPEIEIVGEADNGEQGIEMVEQLQPDLVLLDLNMHGMNGIETLVEMKKRDTVARIVILTVSDAQDDIVAAMRNGADGYLLKDMPPEELMVKFREVAEGRLVMSHNIAESLARAMHQTSQRPKDVDDAGLTEREKEILTHLAQGESNKVIARNLNIAEATVKVHVKHLLKKLGFKSRVEAAVWAVENR